MDNIILGLLILRSRTIYQLHERIAEGLNLMYSNSMGSIQAALKKLSKCGYIEYEEIIENGKYKKIYFITDSGKEHFFDWVNTPMSMQNNKNPELAKLYFMGFSDREHRTELLIRYIAELKKQYHILEAIYKEGEAMELNDIGAYQLESAKYGRDLMLFNIRWFQKLLREEKNK